MQTDLDLNGHRLLNNNLRYTINGFFDSTNISEFDFTFNNKADFFVFMNPCTIKDYIFIIEEPSSIFLSQTLIFTKYQYNIKNHSTPNKISELRKSHQRGLSYSYGILNINMPKASYIKITAASRFIGNQPFKPSFRKAKIALLIEM